MTIIIYVEILEFRIFNSILYLTYFVIRINDKIKLKIKLNLTKSKIPKISNLQS